MPLSTASSPGLLADENVPAPLVRLLRAAGLNVEYVAETMPSVSDRTVIQHAVTTGRWILTFDRDYGELVFTHLAPPPQAIVFLRQSSLTMSDYAERVLALTATRAEVEGYLVVVEGSRVRLRPLPGPEHAVDESP
jgi:predicted nuclease of predicted toxin-antitoxin system